MGNESLGDVRKLPPGEREPYFEASSVTIRRWW